MSKRTATEHYIATIRNASEHPDGRAGEIIDRIFQQLTKDLEERLGGLKRTDTRGTTQNPNNPRYLTRRADAHNKAIDQAIETIKEYMEATDE